jgi:hypothetical protein
MRMSMAQIPTLAQSQRTASQSATRVCSILTSNFPSPTNNFLARESGVDDGAASKFPGGSVTYGSAASGAGNNRDIPEHEGGGINPATGQSYKAGDFEGGVGAPEKRDASYSARHGGEPDADAPVRQGQGQTGAK